MLDSSFKRRAVRACQASPPKGDPRFALRRRDSSSRVVSARLTRASQWRGGRTGQFSGGVNQPHASGCSRRARLDQGQASARRTRLKRLDMGLDCRPPADFVKRLDGGGCGRYDSRVENRGRDRGKGGMEVSLTPFSPKIERCCVVDGTHQQSRN